MRATIFCFRNRNEKTGLVFAHSLDLFFSRRRCCFSSLVNGERRILRLPPKRKVSLVQLAKSRPENSFIELFSGQATFCAPVGRAKSKHLWRPDAFGQTHGARAALHANCRRPVSSGLQKTRGLFASRHTSSASASSSNCRLLLVNNQPEPTKPFDFVSRAPPPKTAPNLPFLLLIISSCTLKP